MKIIEDEGYKVTYDPAEKIVTFSGTLRLAGLNEYAPIIDCIEDAFTECDNLTLVLTDLCFLNSSGIAMFSKFVISARNNQGCKLTIIGSKEIPWQGKSLKNLQRLMPALNLILE